MGGLRRGPRLAAPVRDTARSEAGFTLVEVLVALTILSVVSIGVLYGVLSFIRLSGDGQARVAAAAVAAEVVDEARLAAEYDLAVITTTAFTRDVGGRSYEVLRSATWQPADEQTDACETGMANENLYLRVSVRVTWQNMGSTEPVRSDTLIAPRSQVYEPGTGSAGVRVLGADGTPSELVLVEFTGPSPLSLLTDERGCAFAPSLQQGDYTVTASRTGYVDPSGTERPEADLQVVAARGSALQIALDEAATVEVAFDAPADDAGNAYPLAQGTRLNLANSSLQSGSRSVEATSSPMVVDDVFPYPDGWTVRLGTCTDATGGASAGPTATATTTPTSTTSSPTSSPTSATSSPTGTTTTTGTASPSTGASGTAPGPSAVAGPAQGETVAVTIRVARLAVRVSNSAGSPMSGVVVRASHPSESVTGCTGGETLTLGVTDGQGYVRAAMPFGSGWLIDSTNVSSDGPVSVTLPASQAVPAEVGLTVSP